MERPLPQQDPSYLSSSTTSISSFKGSKHHNQDGKIVVKEHGNLALLRYWIHVAAILFTGGLAALNFLNVFFMDANDPEVNTKLNLFQFAAKSHEGLIIGSMMLALMDTVRSRLTSTEGVPLGYLLSPVLFNDLDFVVSPEFWSCLIRPNMSTLPLTIMILTAIIFANIAGPLSAILIVPRLGWSKPVVAGAFPSFFNASASSIWPTKIHTTNLLPECFSQAAGAVFNARCPASALKSLSTTTNMGVTGGATAWKCLNKGIDMSCNTTMSVAGSTHTWSLEYDFFSLSPVVSSQKVDIFSPLQNRVKDGLATLIDLPGVTSIDASKPEVLDLHFFGNKDLLKPMVRTTCEDLNYTRIYQIYKDNRIQYDWSTPAGFFLKDTDSSTNPSFIYSWLKNDSWLRDAQPCKGESCYKSVACAIDARYVPLSLWFNIQQPDTPFQSDPQPSKSVRSGKFDEGVSITLGKGLMDSFTVQGSTNVSVDIGSILNNNNIPQEERPESFEVFKDTLTTDVGFVNYTQAIAMMLSTMTVEFLAWGPTSTGHSIYIGNCSFASVGFTYGDTICGRNESYWMSTDSIGGLDANFSMVNFTLRNNGYGWFFEGITVKIALAILLFHASLTSVYLIHSTIGRRQITTHWSTAPELFTLAINSLRAPVLVDHSTGVAWRERHIWRELVTVRETDSGEELSLVVGHHMDYGSRIGDLPAAGKKYC